MRTSSPSSSSQKQPTPIHKPTVNSIQPTPTVNTAKPTPTPVPQLSLAFTKAINELVSIHTLPGASLTIKVYYACSKRDATSQSLQGTFSADSNGNYTWTWTNQSSCHGNVTATVTSSSGGKTVTSSANLTD
jgi:hypothetical protein